MRSFQDQIRAIVDRGEPIDFEGLLAWPEPRRESGDGELLENAFHGSAPAKPAGKDDDSANCNEPSGGSIESWLRASTEELRAVTPLIKALEEPQTIPTKNAYSYRPLDVAAIVVADCRVDWRTRIRAGSYFDDASSIHFGIHKIVEYLVNELPEQSLHPHQIGPIRKAIDLTWSLGSIHLGIVNLVRAACIANVSDAIQSLLNQAALHTSQIGTLSKALQPLDDETLYLKSLVGERVFGLDAIRQETGHTTGDDGWWHDVGGRKTGKHAHYLTYMADLIDIARGPAHTWRDRVDEVQRVFERRVSINDIREPLAGLWMVKGAVLGTLTKLRLCLGALYIASNPKLALASATTIPYIDPYTAERLRCASNGDQVRLWSDGSSDLVRPIEFTFSLQTRVEQ